MSTIVITGSTNGIGKAAAIDLASKDHHLILISRDENKLRRTVKEIKESTGNSKIEYLKSDLSEPEEINQLVEKIKATTPHIDILINNAGGYFDKRRTNSKGTEYTFALNHLAYFQLTLQIWDLILKGSEQRIINVSSEAEKPGHIHFEDINLTKNYSGFKAYCQSKLANLLFTYELERKRKAAGLSGLSIHAMHPGVVRTGFGKNNSGFMNFMVKLVGPFMRSPEKGAETIIFLAESEKASSYSGRYWKDKKQLRSNQESYSEEVAQKLWDLSLEITGITDPFNQKQLVDK